MSIEKCRECGKDVSSEAKACPHCGASEPVPPKGVGKIVTIAAIIFAIYVGAQCSDSTNAPNKTATPASPRPPTEEELKSSARHMCSEFVKRSAHDPRSLDWDRRFEWPVRHLSEDTWEVDMKFRGKNGFGATVLNTKTCGIRVRGEDAALLYLK